VNAQGGHREDTGKSRQARYKGKAQVHGMSLP
jgi:hypothetical protein